MRPSAELQAWIRREIDAQPPDGSLGNWPRQIMNEHDVLLIDGNDVVLWFIGLDGTLYSLDTDRIARKLEPESDPEIVRDVIARAAERFPELVEYSQGLQRNPT